MPTLRAPCLRRYRGCHSSVLDACSLLMLRNLPYHLLEVEMERFMSLVGDKLISPVHVSAVARAAAEPRVREHPSPGVQVSLEVVRFVPGGGKPNSL